jgi:hypothetical protein
VRYDRAVGSGTAVKFMTDGILMREVQDDFLLRKYSVVVIDEAHERSLNTDLLLGMACSRFVLRLLQFDNSLLSGAFADCTEDCQAMTEVLAQPHAACCRQCQPFHHGC